MYSYKEGCMVVTYDCNSCNRVTHLQIVFAANESLKTNCMLFPEDGQFYFPNCGAHHNLEELRKDLEIAYREK